MRCVEHDRYVLVCGDAVEVMSAMPDACVDAIVTDPPYGLEFMGQEWDRPWAVSPSNAVGYAGRDDLRLPAHRDNRNANCRACGGRQRGAKRRQCATPEWDRAPITDMQAYQAWCETWAIEALRLLKPGGHLLAFGGTRTYHRLACAVEDAGFEVRDQIGWLYGQGFPKSRDVSKAIDEEFGAEREVVGPNEWAARGGLVQANTYGAPSRPPETAPTTDAARQWAGWGTALKPAWEPILVARKPLVGTVAENVLDYGTGAINVDGCRVALTGESNPSIARRATAARTGWDNRGGAIMNDRRAPERYREYHPSEALGRWPANVVHDGSDEVMEAFAAYGDRRSAYPGRQDLADAYVGAPVSSTGVTGFPNATAGRSLSDSGTAARFFYCAKASRAERGEGNRHPTVKPLALMQWLARLVTPPGGLVLDPFMGSGTTGLAAMYEGFAFVGVDNDGDSFETADRRLAEAMTPTAVEGA